VKNTNNTTINHPIKGRVDIQSLEEHEAYAILSSIPFLGGLKIKLLISHYGSSLKALLADKEEIRQFPGFGSRILTGWDNWIEDSKWKKNLLLVAEHQAKMITPSSPGYPSRLLEAVDHPGLLYMKGSLLPKDQNCIAIVGTRKASVYGYEMAIRFAKELSSHGYTIVSGLARGIDTGAHIGALETGRTIAVIGSGLADIYPVENKGLSERIMKKGALLSEFPMATPPDRHNFPQRNRIVSGMVQGIILIEAPRKSGAMITMEIGAQQNKKLFALPGRADMETFKGNHFLIKSGRAQLVESAKDVMEGFGDLFSGLSKNKPETGPKIPLEKEEEEFIKSLPEQEVSIEEIVQMTKMPIAKINVLLMGLLLKKAIKEYPGKQYIKNGAYS